MLQNEFKSLPCLIAKRHIPCRINQRLETDKFGYLQHDIIGCKEHNRTRKGTKKDCSVYGVFLHCYCGFDLKCQYQGKNQWEYLLFEKTYCTPENHYRSDPGCSYSRWSWRSGESEQCGWHGLKYPHCILCKEPLEGEVLGTVNGQIKYAPSSLAKRIWRALISF